MAPSGDPAPWYRRTFVGMEVGPSPESELDPEDAEFARHLSGSEVVEQQLRIGSEYLVVWARDPEFAYYDSRLCPKAPGLGDRDFLRECVDAARGRGLPIIAYCRVQHEGYCWRQHPEWRMVGCDGKEKRNQLCLNSGYAEFIKQVALEMLGYGVQGFHFDMLDLSFGEPHGCYCATNCQPRFLREYGVPMPTPPCSATWDEPWDRVLEFLYNTVERFEDDVRRAILAQAPGVSLDFNYHGRPPHSWHTGQRPVQHARPSDFVTGETGTHLVGAQTGLLVEFLRAAKPDSIGQAVIVRGVHGNHEHTTRPVNDFRWEVCTHLAHGGTVTVIDKTTYDGRLTPVFYDRLGEVFGEVGRRRAHFGQPPLREVGLFYSHRVRDWYGREDPYRYHGAFYGAQGALGAEHIPYGVVLDEGLSAEVLARFPVIYAPQAAILSEAEVGLLGAYVAGGGGLLLTGLCGLYDRMGAERPGSAVEELAGVRLVGRPPALDHWVRLTGGGGTPPGLVRGLRTDWPFLAYGPAAVFEAAGAAAYGELLEGQRTLRQRRGEARVRVPGSPGAVVGPAVFERAQGRGRVLLVPCSPDAALTSDYALPEDRRWIGNLVRHLHPEPEVEVEAPVFVEAVPTRAEGEAALRVHLIAHAMPGAFSGPQWTAGALVRLVRMEDAPMYRAVVRTRAEYGRVEVLGERTQWRRLGPREVELTVQDVHEAVILRP